MVDKIEIIALGISVIQWIDECYSLWHCSSLILISSDDMYTYVIYSRALDTFICSLFQFLFRDMQFTGIRTGRRDKYSKIKTVLVQKIIHLCSSFFIGFFSFPLVFYIVNLRVLEAYIRFHLKLKLQFPLQNAAFCLEQHCRAPRKASSILRWYRKERCRVLQRFSIVVHTAIYWRIL